MRIVIEKQTMEVVFRTQGTLRLMSIRSVNCRHSDFTATRGTDKMVDGIREDGEVRRRRDLGEFLRAKRAALKPSDFGLPNPRRRRAPGLRREELAQISGIGVTWYTWLEQGRDIHVSTDLLQRLTRALRLSPHDAAYLFSLAGQPQTPPLSEGRGLIDGLQTVLEGYTLGPAMVVDAMGTTLACNQLGNFVYHFSGYDGPWGDNIFWRLFMDPYRRQMYVDWPDFARYGVGLMRGLYASRRDDSAYQGMIDDLCKSCPDFHRMWIESIPLGTSSIAPNPLRLQVSKLEPLSFVSVRLAVPTKEAWAIFLSPLDETTTAAMLRLGRNDI
jgi:transcriptional regulator with XRE-family HTH domain